MPELFELPGLFTVSDPTGGGVTLDQFVAHGYKWITYQAVNRPSTLSPDLQPAKDAGFWNVGVWGVVYSQADFHDFGVALGQQAVTLGAQHVIVDAEECLKNTRPGGAASIITGLRDGGWFGPAHLSTLGAPSNPTVNDFAMDVQSFLDTGGGILPQAYANESLDYTPENCKTYWTRFAPAGKINYTIASYTGALGHIDGNGWIPLLLAAGVTFNFSIFLAETTTLADLEALDVFTLEAGGAPPASGTVYWRAEHDGALLADYTVNHGASVSAGELVASGSGLSYATKDLVTRSRTGHFSRFYARRVSGDVTARLGLFRCWSDTPRPGDTAPHTVKTVYAFWVENGQLMCGTPFDDNISSGSSTWGAQPLGAWNEYAADDTGWVCIEAHWRFLHFDGAFGRQLFQVLVNGNPVFRAEFIGAFLPDHFDVGFWGHQGGGAAEWHFDHVAVRDDPMLGLWGAFDDAAENVYLLHGWENGETSVTGGEYAMTTLELPVTSLEVDPFGPGGTADAVPPVIVAAPGDRPGYALDCGGGPTPPRISATGWGGGGGGYQGPDPIFGVRAAYSFYFWLDGYADWGPLVDSSVVLSSQPISRIIAADTIEPNPVPGGTGPAAQLQDAAGGLGIDSRGWLHAIPDLFNIRVENRPPFGPILTQNPRSFKVNHVSLNRWHHVEVIADTITPGAWRMWVRLNGVTFGPYLGDTSSIWDGRFGANNNSSYNRWQSPPLTRLEIGKLGAIQPFPPAFISTSYALPIKVKDVCSYAPTSFPLGGTRIRKKSPNADGTHNADVTEWFEGHPPVNAQTEQLALVGVNQNFDGGTWDPCGQPFGWSASANTYQGLDADGLNTIPYSSGATDCIHCADLNTGNAARSFVVEGPDGDEPPAIAGFSHGALEESTFGANTIRLCSTGVSHTGRWTVFAWVKGPAPFGPADAWELNLGDASGDPTAFLFENPFTTSVVETAGAWTLLRFDGTFAAAGLTTSFVFRLFDGGGGSVRKITGVRLYFDYVDTPAVAGFWKSGDSGASWLSIQNSDSDVDTYIDELPAVNADQIGVSRNSLSPGQPGYDAWINRWVELQQEDADAAPLAARFYVKGTGWTFDAIPPQGHNVGVVGAAMKFRVRDPGVLDRRLTFTSPGFVTGGVTNKDSWNSTMMNLAVDATAWTLDKWNRLRWRIGYQDDRSTPSAVVYAQHFELLLPEPELSPEPRPVPPREEGGISIDAHFRAGEPGTAIPAGPPGIEIDLDPISFRVG